MVRLVEFETKELPFDIVEDMKIFMRNDKDFYRRHYMPCMVDLQKKVKAKDSNFFPALKPMVEAACAMYNSKYNVCRDPKELLTLDDTKMLMSSICREEMDRLRNGEY